MGKGLYSLKDGTTIKVNVLSAEMGITKSAFVDMAIDRFEDDLAVRILNIQSNIKKLQNKINSMNEEISTLTTLKEREDGLIKSLESQKKIYKANIKRKMNEGDVMGAVEIAKRVGRLLRCPYLDLLP